MHSGSIFKIVVMGASAGGIDALRVVLSGLSPDLPVPVVIVQHLSAEAKPTRLAEVLSRHCRLPVSMARSGIRPPAGTVWVAEPGRHLRVLEQQGLALDKGPPVRFVRPSIDVLFGSAAKSFGQGVMGIVLSGIGSDGAHGCRKIKTAGGMVLAQDPQTAAFPDMPRAAIATGVVENILPLEAISAHILRIVGSNPNQS